MKRIVFYYFSVILLGLFMSVGCLTAIPSSLFGSSINKTLSIFAFIGSMLGALNILVIGQFIFTIGRTKIQ